MKQSKKFKSLFGLILMVTTLLISSCVLDITEVHQPETGYTNNKVVTTIRANFLQSGTASYLLSILMPLDWEIANNQITYKFANSEQLYSFNYDAYNTNRITGLEAAPTGYYWWSGISEESNVVIGDKAVAYVVFNTGDATGDYNLKYNIGDSVENDLFAYTSGDKAITLTAQPQDASLSDGRVFPELNSNPWDVHSFEVMYNSPSRTIPTSYKLYLDEVEYDLNLLAASYHNGKFGCDIDWMEKGTHEYYFLFDNTLRYPAGSENLEITINDIDVYDFPLTENFEIDSQSLHSWEMDGYWQIEAPGGYNGDPASAFEGNISAGTMLLGDGLTIPDSISILESPIFDARNQEEVILSFDHYSIFSQDSYLDIGIQLFPSQEKIFHSKIYTDSDGWKHEILNLSNMAAGQLFRVYFYFNTEAIPCAGTTIDMVSLVATAYYDAEMYFTNDISVADPGYNAEFLFDLANIGTDTDTYSFEISGIPEYSYQLQRQDSGASTWSDIAFTGLILDADGATSLRLISTIPLDPISESEEIEFVLTSDNGVTNSQTLTTMVRPSILGNDNYGYIMYSSDYSDLVEFSWIDPTNATTIEEADLYSDTPINLDFGFSYYASNYYSIYLTPYAGVSFDYNSGYDNIESIPGADSYNNLIGLYWGALALEKGGDAYYEQVTLAGQAAFVLTFEDCYTSNDKDESFKAQLILFENGQIKFQYSDIPDYVRGTYPLVGIEDYNGTDGINFQAGFNALKNDYALLFSSEFVANNPQPESYTSTLSTTDLSWSTTGDFSTMKVYFKESSNLFEDSDIIYTGAPIDYLANSILPQLNLNSTYYWQIVGETSDGYELASPVYEFNTNPGYLASGTVTDSYTELPIEGVLVALMDLEGEFKSSRESVYTDANGYWSMTLPENGYYFEFTKDGYETQSQVYLGLWEDTVLDVEMSSARAYNPNPASGSQNISTSPTLSWINPANYNHTKVEIATNENMTDAILAYDGTLIDILNNLPILETSTYYYWQVTLSQDGLSNFSASYIWRFITDFTEAVPTPDYTEQFSNYSTRKATKASSGYLLPGGDFGAAQQIIKTDEAGNIVWQHTYSTATSVFRKAIEMDNGHYLVIRDETTSYVLGEETGLSEVTSSGEIIWNQSYKYYEGNNYANEDVDDGIIDSSGNVVICGGTGFDDWNFLLTKASLNESDPIWQKSYGNAGAQEKCHSVVESSSGGYIMAGYRAGTPTNDIGNSRILVIKVNSSGTTQWEYEEDNVNSTDGITTTGYKAIETNDGSIIVVGNAYNHNTDFENNQSIVIKLSASGQELWKKYFPIQDYGTAKDVALDGHGNIFLAGIPDAMKLDSDGNLLWFYNDEDYAIGNDFSSIMITDNGFTIAGGDKLTIFGDNTSGPLPIPENLSVTIIGDQVELSWGLVTGATSYRIESSTEPNGTYGYEATSPTNSWNGTSSGERKFFRVRAEN